MKKLLIILSLMMGVSARADVLTDILDRVYQPESLSEWQQDSVLGDTVLTGRYRLEYENRQQLFRRSFMADYYIIDTKTGSRKPLTDGPARDAVISPNGKYIAFAKADNNLYLHKLDFGTEVAVTQDVQESDCFNGISDWLYEEEFGTTCLMAFSPDSKQLAYVHLDERGVPTFSWQTYLTDDPQQGSYNGNYPLNHSLRYPRAGDKNAGASLHVYTIANKDIQTIQLPIDEDAYLPRILWRTMPAQGKAAESYQLIAETLDRDQTEEVIYACNAQSLVATPLYRERSDEYFVDYELFDSWQWLKDGRFIMLSEKDGWRSAYLMSAQGIELRRLVQQDMDLTDIYGYDEATQTLYYQAAPLPRYRVVYALNLKNGKTTIIGPETGWNSLHLSNDYKQAILAHESDQEPISYTLYDTRKLARVREVKNNNGLLARWQSLELPAKVFTTINGCEAWIDYPREFDASKQYPVILMQYSGPASQQVQDRWRRKVGYAFADMGYVVVNIDPRGTECRGRAWRNATYMHISSESQDHIAAAEWVAAQPWSDRHRIAMIGWSFGGYETLTTLCLQPLQEDGTPLIAKGIAIAPVTDWRLYDSAYTERYMRRPQVNEQGYDEADVTRKAKNLKGELLLVHGSADDNVHVQNAYRMAEALDDAGILYQMMIYPDDNHFMRNGNHYHHLHRLIVQFLK